jgi:uncharacterized membrane protein required for colicin V production
MITISWLDVLMVLVLVGSMAFGLRQGLLRQLILLLAFYLGIVVAANYYSQTGELLVNSVAPSASIEMARIVAFVALFVIVTFVLIVAFWTAYRQTKLPTAYMLDEVAGTVLGAVGGLVLVNLILAVGWQILETPWPDGGGGFTAFLQSGLVESSLKGAFSIPMPLIQATLSPLIPADVPLLDAH